ncbi:MAG: protein-L-isoaspartate(D-aspartate) O-methyltransferase [Pyrinomonadaceae bacterium]|nr:protein-L-isoaspartate(D-aspartate) O-methyltransferase [Pyrinomonadaceae bacterium]
MADEFEISRTKMVQRLRDHYKIADERVLDVMQKVPRHLFVPEALKFQAYKDNALPIAGNQTISQPFIVARMTELLELKPSDRILEIGAGSGYQSAVLSKLARTIYAVERVPALAKKASERLSELGIKNVSVKCDDGTLGWEVYAPFDAVLVAAGGPVIPEPLVAQLKVGGRLVIPLGKDTKTQELVRVTRNESGFSTENFGACAFVPLIGQHGWQKET